MKVVRAIQNCIAQLADPKRPFVTDREWRREFSKMMEMMAKADAESKENSEHTPLMTFKGGRLRQTKKITAVKKS